MLLNRSGAGVGKGVSMKCKRSPLIAEVNKYEVGKGLEDGFLELSEVITMEHIRTEHLVQIKEGEKKIVCPYIETRRGKTFIEEGDYVIAEEDGTKNVCGEDRVWKRYDKCE